MSSNRLGKVCVLLLSAMTLILGCKQNQAPERAAVPSGPSSGAVGIEYTFWSNAEDSTGKDVAIRFDWGDGDTSQWSPWVRPGDTVKMSHTWTASGTFNTRAQAKAQNSATSDWSDALAVSSYYEWIRTYGGALEDEGWSVQLALDSGYIVTGSNRSQGAGESDAWLLKIDVYGDTAWTRLFGGAHYDWGMAVERTEEGGYIIAGTTYSFSVGGFRDVWLVKTDGAGNREWDRAFGWANYDEAYSVQQTEDGGYVAAGYNTLLDTGGVWLLKTDADGDTLWTTTLDHKRSVGRCVRQTRDGGYVVAAVPVAENHAIRLIKTDASGNISWAKSFGDGWNWDSGMSVQQTQDGGYIVAGTTCYNNGVRDDVLLVKTDSLGNEVWDRTFGGEHDDWGSAAQPTRDGGYIVVGSTSSFGTLAFDVWLIKTDANGDTVWTRTFGLNHDDMGFSVQQTLDGGFIITGTTESYGVGLTDVLLIKTDPEGRVHQSGGE